MVIEGEGSSSQQVLGDLVAQETLALYSSLAPSSYAPLSIKNGAVEWTVLSSVSLVLPSAQGETPRVIPISLGTGTKTIPYDTLVGTPGDVLHNLHAEVLARRGARTWLALRIAAEARWTMQRGEQSQDDDAAAIIDDIPLLLERDLGNHKWKLRHGIKVWWYVSTLPCGECSMPHLARKRAKEDELVARGSSVTYQHPNTSLSHSSTNAPKPTTVLRGRQFAAATDSTDPARPQLRTIPGRPDSQPSLCHSCSDKILLWATLGWQGSALTRLLSTKMPIDGVVVSVCETEISEAGGDRLLREEIRRGIDVRERCPDGGAELSRRLIENGIPTVLKPPEIHLTTASFPLSQCSVRQRAKDQGIHLDSQNKSTQPSSGEDVILHPAWESSSYIRPTSLDKKSSNKLEKHIQGIKQGASVRRPVAPSPLPHGLRAPLNEKSRSRLCKLEFFQLLRRLSKEVGVEVPMGSYANLKGKDVASTSMVAGGKQGGEEWYRRCKAVLRGEPYDEGLGWEESDAREQDAVKDWMAKIKRTRSWEREEKTSLDQLDQLKSIPRDDRTSSDEFHAPMKGWLVTPRSLEAFDSAGTWI